MEFIDYIIQHMELDLEEIETHKNNWEKEKNENDRIEAKRSIIKITLQRLKIIEASKYKPTEKEIDAYIENQVEK